jgi:hypothetical protein
MSARLLQLAALASRIVATHDVGIVARARVDRGIGPALGPPVAATVLKIRGINARRGIMGPSTGVSPRACLRRVGRVRGLERISSSFAGAADRNAQVRRNVANVLGGARALLTREGQVPNRARQQRHQGRRPA